MLRRASISTVRLKSPRAWPVAVGEPSALVRAKRLGVGGVEPIERGPVGGADAVVERSKSVVRADCLFDRSAGDLATAGRRLLGGHRARCAKRKSRNQDRSRENRFHVCRHPVPLSSSYDFAPVIGVLRGGTSWQIVAQISFG